MLLRIAELLGLPAQRGVFDEIFCYKIKQMCSIIIKKFN